MLIQKMDTNNLKDSERKTMAAYETSSTGVSVTYAKTNKLITALYMVTDIIDKDEPLRNKLRTLGAEVISDMYTVPFAACDKVHQILSFLDIASAINIISQMNSNILKKEFLELNYSIQGSTDETELHSKQINLSEFFRNELPTSKFALKDKQKSIGHRISTRIGVQKGSTLMKALSEKTNILSDMNNTPLNTSNFDIVKRQRRQDIIVSIQKNDGSATITDIRNKAEGSLVLCSEKTLQRELITMIKDNVLYKTGEKRWSRYFVKKGDVKSSI